MPYKTCDNCGQSICYPVGGKPRCICKAQVPPATIKNEETGVIAKRVQDGPAKASKMPRLRKNAFRDTAPGDGDGVEGVPEV